MATTAPQNPSLPLLYNDLVPLSSIDHAGWRVLPNDNINFMRGVHAVPVTIDEFSIAQRNFPIIFSVGDNPVPLALMGLNEGVNTFIDEAGRVPDPVYLPAYVRRYPFLLARLRPEAEELSLCFDPTHSIIGPGEEGDALFDGLQPAERTKAILSFCEEFEASGKKTGQFMAELAEHKLLMDGEVSIQTEDAAAPYIYRGFQMVDETKLRELRGDVLRKMMQSGMLPLIHAHLFSLQLMREIFGRQLSQNKVPAPDKA